MNKKLLAVVCAVFSFTIAMQQRDDRLFWIDLEMTGLDPKKEDILEIATLVTDNDLNLVAEGPELVIHHDPNSAVIKNMDAWNVEHHTKSGLLEKVFNSEITLEEAQKQTLEFIKKYCTKRSAPLCGNSVHQDRKFLDKYMPEVDEFLHYRIIDVSTVKELAGRWYNAKYKKPENHRALEDILASVEELKYYRASCFKEKI